MYISKNPRPYVLQNVLELATVIHAKGWSLQSVLAAVDGIHGEPASKVLASLVEADKSYACMGQKYTGKALVELCERGEENNEMTIVDGRHRGLALALANGKRDVEGKPSVKHVVVRVDNGQLAALEGNAANDYVTRLDRRSKVNEALALYKAGTYKQEADLPFKRGFNQYVHSACACLLAGAAEDEVLTLDKETLRKCSREVDVAAAVHAAYAANGGDKTPEKPLTGKQLLALAELATKANSPLAVLLTAIATGNELHAQGIVRASAVATENAESNRNETSKQTSKKTK